MRRNESRDGEGTMEKDRCRQRSVCRQAGMSWSSHLRSLVQKVKSVAARDEPGGSL